MGNHRALTKLIAVPVFALGSRVAQCSGFSFSPSDREMLLMLLVAFLPVFVGVGVGVFTAGKFRAWKSLLCCGAVVLALLLLVFLQDEWRRVASLVVPVLFMAYLCSHALAHWVVRRIRRKRAGATLSE